MGLLVFWLSYSTINLHKLFPLVEMNSNNSFPLNLPTSLATCKLESQTLESQSTPCSVVFRMELLPVTLLSGSGRCRLRVSFCHLLSQSLCFFKCPTVVCDSYRQCRMRTWRRDCQRSDPVQPPDAQLLHSVTYSARVQCYSVPMLCLDMREHKRTKYGIGFQELMVSYGNRHEKI